MVVGDRPAPVGVEAEREGGGDVGLEVEHEVAADQSRGVGDPATQQQPRRLECATGEHDVGRGHFMAVADGVEVAHRTGPSTRFVEDDLGGHGAGSDLAAPASQGSAQRRHRVSFGVDRTAVLPTEAAVVAGGPAVVVGGVDARGCPVGVVAHPGRSLGREDGAVHVGPRSHRVGPGAPRLVRVDAGLAGHPDEALGLGVAGLELGVVERPVVQIGAVDRTAFGQQAEVQLAEPGHLGVGVDGPSADS